MWRAVSLRESVQQLPRAGDGGTELWVELGHCVLCCVCYWGMLLGTMQEDGPGAHMLLVPTVKTRATDFSIAAIMARGPRGERRATCGAAAAAAAAAHHSIGLPTLGKFVT